MSILIPSLSIAAKASQALAEGVRRVELAGPWGSAKSLAALQVAQALHAPLLVLTSGRIDAENVFEDLATFDRQDLCVMLPAWEVLPSERMDPSDDIVAERMNTLERLHQSYNHESMRITLPMRSLMQRVIARKTLESTSLRIKEGDEYDLEELLLRLTRLGYERELMVEKRGQMSLRGGILDVFPISGELPYRIEFFGDMIESIRRFEPETQRSISPAPWVDLSPRSEKEMLLGHGAAAPLSDYLPPDTLVAIDEPAAVEEEARKLETQMGSSPWMMTSEQAWDMLKPFRTLFISQIAPPRRDDTPRFSAPMHSLANWQPPASDYWEQLDQWQRDEYRIYTLCGNSGERQRMLELLEEHGHLPSRDSERLTVEVGRLRAGFASEEDRLAVVSDREVFGRHHIRRTRRRFEAGETITAFSDLRHGDYIVHAVHGIGRYLGMRRFEGQDGDFLIVQYSGGDKLYLPVTSVDMIQKYTGGDGAMPKVDKLGGASWAKTRARVKKAVRDMTDELLKLYAARESQQGHAFNPDSPWQVEFEDAFEYDETPDQLRAINDVKRDMESTRPMDRLLCGDVGFGKTEVALRAAFKAVQDGKQAALLVPTTVLAEQHYLNFAQRLADYPISVGLLCRFRSPKENKETIEKIKSGEVDIIVGTHRLLSKDVRFHDLGLLIIDEEHRFGVAQKERLKQMRCTVDVLTMSATPIPRTLNLSLLGVRDMSQINTAPNDRLPVHTCIESFDEELIREAIRRELARQGQVFFLHNRVQTIEAMAGVIHNLVPEARIAIGHGQMPDSALEDVMTRFVRHTVDVLVCTTIIGSGIDIPNANTIIINRADCFGLSELYQLRGRVGRYKHRAFAYLMVDGDRVLSEDAQKRLKALEDFSSLGAGYRIALRDLEIRGCGNILGAEQSGYIISVGLDTYVQLVSETVAELKGEPVARRYLPPFELTLDAYIPERYVASESQKMTLYRRISNIKTVEEADEMLDELADRFGRPPEPVRRLLDVMRVRAIAAELGVSRMSASKDTVKVEFESSRFLGRGARTALTQRFGKRITFQFEGTPAVTCAIQAETPEALLAGAKHILHALTEQQAAAVE